MNSGINTIEHSVRAREAPAKNAGPPRLTCFKGRTISGRRNRQH